ncbi:hypothetical protein DFP72DRAFT_810059 [Ephemerocybe angulata]|uniref:Arrestin-like N-terminal domain-containing protein n=1 Tax=Ephemerocybe angulata TaxID=980116 RepID=A0A8H6M6H3_9AGAR|nr:hypothetical protein DFP72DRAFT_810059 [Tulosesus angulatus]
MFRWGSRRSSRHTNDPTVDSTSSPGQHNAGSVDPPRYSNISTAGLSEPRDASAESNPDHADESTFQDSDSHSIFSLDANSTAPTYTTHDRRAPATSLRTLTNPPRYSTMSTFSMRSGESFEGAPTEYTFPIRSGFGKSKPWATLRLYNPDPARPAASNGAMHPRFTDEHVMLGNVELDLSGPQTIRSIKLVLKGVLITSASHESGSLAFLDQTYLLWDRKFGDPRELAQAQSQGLKADGKIFGNWLFPFSIPFPSRVDRTSLAGVYTSEDDGPVRLLPQFVRPDSPISPFREDDSPLSAIHETPRSQGGEQRIIPFDVGHPPAPISRGEKGASRNYIRPAARNGSPASASDISSMLPLYQPAPESPTLHPYTTSKPTNFVPDSTPKLSPPTGERLPQTFLERDVHANIQYELTLVVSHGRFASESRARTAIVYSPVSKPPPMPFNRQAAYSHRRPLPNPDVDPDSWYQLEPTHITGTYVQQQDLNISYCRGTVIPCWLTIACEDMSALNIFSDPRSPRVRLRRFTRFFDNQTPDDYYRESAPPTMHPFGAVANMGASLPPKFASQFAQQIGSGAVWWIPQDVTQQPGLRKLMGELHLPRGLQPSCPFPLFNVLYRIELLAPRSHAFEPHLTSSLSSGKDGTTPLETHEEAEERRDHVYTSLTVEITTDMRSDEPRPIPFTKRG